MKTDPESLIALLGVDQSVLLLKSGNDLDSSQIFNDLSSYDTSTPYVRGYGEYPGRTSGLVTLTNANYPFSTGKFFGPACLFDFLIFVFFKNLLNENEK